MHPLLSIIYHFFKLIIRISLRVYFKKTTVVGFDKKKTAGPCIVISNHPATLLDPLNAAVHVPRYVHFIANAGLFKTAFTNWFFTTFFCIRIERYVDTDGRPLNNDTSFNLANRFLTNGGCLYIAPEGISFVERHLRKIKTGTARIALNTEVKNDFKLGLEIVPVGVNYSDPTRPRSEVLTIYGDSIRVADYREDWEKDPVEAVVNLSAHIRERLSGLMIDAADEREDHLLHLLETMVENEAPLKPYARFRRSRTILGRLQEMRKTNGFDEYYEQVEKYFALLRSLRIGDAALVDRNGAVLIILKLALLLPFAIVGMLLFLLPVTIGRFIHNRINDDPHWAPTYKYMIGLVLFPLLIGLEIWAVAALTGPGWVKWAMLVGFIPAGLAAEYFLQHWRLLLEKLRVRKYLANNEKESGELLALRLAILQKIQQL